MGSSCCCHLVTAFLFLLPLLNMIHPPSLPPSPMTTARPTPPRLPPPHPLYYCCPSQAQTKTTSPSFLLRCGTTCSQSCPPSLPPSLLSPQTSSGTALGRPGREGGREGGNVGYKAAEDETYMPVTNALLLQIPSLNPSIPPSFPTCSAPRGLLLASMKNICGSDRRPPSFRRT